MARSFIDTSSGTPVRTPLVALQAEIYSRGDDEDAGRHGLANLGFATLVNGEFPGTQLTVTGATWSGGFATLLVGAHSVPVGQIVGLSGVLPSGYNNGGVPVAVSSVDATHITYPLAANPGTYVSGGIARVGGTTAADGMIVRKGGVLYARQGGVFLPIPLVSGVDYQPAIVTPTFAAPTFANSWSNNVSGLPLAKYAKNAVGDLLLRGNIRPGTTNSGYIAVFAALPAGFWPLVDSFIAVVGFTGGGSTAAVGTLKVDTSGVVSLFNTSGIGASIWQIDGRVPLY